jgi:hemin uptake protein HemP
MQEFQEFKTSDAVVAIVLTLVFAVTVASGVQSVLADSSVQRAENHAKKIALQILTGVNPNSEDIAENAASPQRKIASIDLLGPSGEISKDPWGQPYFYRIVSGGAGQKVAVVWSMGPNQRSDTPTSVVSKHDRSRAAESLVFGGDDVGAVVALE